MNKNIIFLLFLMLLMASQAFPQIDSGKIRIYDHTLNPKEHPDYWRKHVKPPTWETFNHRTQFITLRNLEGDYEKKLDDYTVKYNLGRVIWPSYSTLFLDNIDSIVSELKERDLFLFDLWGYVPGSGPGGYWQQFYTPKNVLNMFESQLGDRWLGMDNGEQDGRYIGGFAGQLYPTGIDRKGQYFNFQHHFEALCNELGNKMATLVSLNFGHYFLKEGIYTLIGAETAQGLPNAQVYYSFIRGASKQYGVPWFGNTSVWNRWGYKSYKVDKQYNGGPTKGTSLSLLKRLLYSQIFYNSMMVGFESGFLDGDTLGSIGEIQQHANTWVSENGQPGNMITQVALMVDFYSGWSFPRHLYSNQIYKVWGNLPYEKGDYFTNSVLDMFYPGYQNSSYFHDETGFNVATPYGDVVDCILSDCPLWLMKQYPVIVITGKVSASLELKDKLEAYVNEGGHLITTSSNLIGYENGLSGVNQAGEKIPIPAGQQVKVGDKLIAEDMSFTIRSLNYPSHAKVLAKYGKLPLALQMKQGLGKVTVFSSEMGVADDASHLPVKSEIDQDLKNPFPLLGHVKEILHETFAKQRLFEVGEGLSYIVNRKSPGTFKLLVCNNSWSEKSFEITSKAGEIFNISESPVNDFEVNETGYMPDGFAHMNMGENTENTIAGGRVRIFTVKIDEKNIHVIPDEKPTGNVQNKWLRIADCESIKKAILSRPTFFQHFNGVVIDWKYLNERSATAIENEAGWIKRQKLQVMVDFTSGLNLFPDLRLVNNDSIAFSKSMQSIEMVIEKMSLLGCEHLVLSPHRFVENNFTREQFITSLTSTLDHIGKLAGSYGVDVHVRLSINKSLPMPMIVSMMKELEAEHIFLAPSLPYLSLRSAMDDFASNRLSERISMFFLSSTSEDIFGQLISEHAPLIEIKSKSILKNIVVKYPKTKWVFDGNYQSWENEYQDVTYFEGVRAMN